MFEFKNIFQKKKYITVSKTSLNEMVKVKEEPQAPQPEIPNGMWVKCEKCGRIIYREDLIQNAMVCVECDFHFALNSRERLMLIADEGSVDEFNEGVTNVNPLNFKGYEEKVQGIKKRTGLNEGVVTAKARINGNDCIIAVMDSRFMMGSMGSAVGEKVTRAVEKATEEKLPVIIFTASGGARMQEGILSLMQMAKTSAALKKHSDTGLLYVSVLTHPTTGGVTASFAMLGDLILAEPGALVGFAGRRVVEQTLREKLPEDFQSAEFLLEHGFVDAIVPRKEFKKTLAEILELHKVV